MMECSFDSVDDYIHTLECEQRRLKDENTRFKDALKLAKQHMAGPKPEITAPLGNRLQAALCVIEEVLEGTDKKVPATCHHGLVARWCSECAWEQGHIAHLKELFNRDGEVGV